MGPAMTAPERATGVAVDRGAVVIGFNRAINLPSACTDLTSCPLQPAEQAAGRDRGRREDPAEADQRPAGVHHAVRARRRVSPSGVRGWDRSGAHEAGPALTRWRSAGLGSEICVTFTSERLGILLQ
jgi:hypothetical protein